MGRNVNLTISDITPTGQQVLVDQYEITITANWTGNDGLPKSYSNTDLFPNILNDPGISNAWLKRHLKELVIAAVREKRGVDQ